MNVKEQARAALQKLPPGYKEIALNNFDQFCSPSIKNFNPYIGIPSALILGFPFDMTPEGKDFWDSVYAWAMQKNFPIYSKEKIELPKLPESK